MNKDVEKLIRKLGKLRSVYDHLINSLKHKVLPYSQMNIPYFTGHGSEHSEQIINHLAEMLTPLVLKNMNSREVLILLCSAWLHDIGYLKNTDEKGNKLEADVIHAGHHEFSRYLINKMHLELGLDIALAGIVADVCYCHRRRVDIESFFPNKTRNLEVYPIRVRFLAALLRLADALDTTTQRAPELISKAILELKPELKVEWARHWKACQLIGGIGYNQEAFEIIIDATYKDEQEKQLLMWKFKELYAEFASVKDILVENGLGYTDLKAKLFSEVPGALKEESISGRENFGGAFLPLPNWTELIETADKVSERVLERMRIDKYDPKLYVKRENVEKLFDEFLKSNKIGFAIVSESGFGKTNLLCHLKEKYSIENIVLLYNGAFFTDPDVVSLIIKDLTNSSMCFKQLVEKMGELAEQKKRFMIVLIDGINDYTDSKTLLKNTNEIIGEIECPRIKIVISCRKTIWDLLFDIEKVDVYRQKFFELGEGEGILLDKFTMKELETVYSLYKRKFSLLSNFEDFSLTTKETLQDPIILKFASKAYCDKTIPRNIHLEMVFDEYYRIKIFDEEKRRGDERIRDFLKILIDEMWKRRKDRVPRLELKKNELLRPHFDDLTPSSPYIKLKDEGIIYDVGPLDEAKFTYDRFFEYLIAKKIVFEEELTKERFMELINESKNVEFLRGSIKMALVIGDYWKLIEALANADDYDVRSILVDTLGALAVKDRQKTIEFMDKILDSSNIIAKRLVVLTSIELSPPGINLLVKAMMDDDEAVRKLAVQYSYLLWLRDNQKGEEVTERLASRSFRLLPAIKAFLKRKSDKAWESSFELQQKIFINHYKDPNAVRLVDKLGLERLQKSKIFTLAQKKIILDIGVKVGKDMFMKYWGWRYDDWVLPVFTTPEEHRKIVRDILPCLDSSRILSGEAMENLYEGAGGPLRGIANLVLIVQVWAHPENTLPLVRRLMNSQDERKVLIGLKTLAFASKVLGNLDQDLEQAKMLIYDNQQYRTSMRAFGLNLAERELGRINFITSIMERATVKNNVGVLVDVATELGNIGARFPDNALLTLQQIFDTTNEELHETLVQSLNRIRVIHPNKVELYLRNNYPKLLAELTLLELEHVPIEMFSLIDLFLYISSKMPIITDAVIEMLEKFIGMQSDSDFQKVIKFAIRRSTETWMNRKIIEEYISQLETDVKD